MDDAETLENDISWLPHLTADLKQPIVLEQDGQPMAVLMSIETYEHYQTLLTQQEQISAQGARKAADRVVFGDLVGCALNSGAPLFVSKPKPLWRVPYRSFDGTLLAIVEVDAHTATVLLTAQERTDLLDKVERLVTVSNAPS
jgi:hypothetical protein